MSSDAVDKKSPEYKNSLVAGDFAYWSTWRERVERCIMFTRFGEPDPRYVYKWQSRYRDRSIRPVVEHIVAAGTDWEPKGYVLPTQPQDVEVAFKMQALLDFYEDKLDIPASNEASFRHLYVWGGFIAYVGYDPFRKQPVIQLIDPRSIAWRGSSPLVKDARRFTRRVRIPRDILKSIYGTKAMDARSVALSNQGASLDLDEAKPAVIVTETITDSTGKAIFPDGDAPRSVAKIDSNDVVVMNEIFYGPSYVTDGTYSEIVPGDRCLLSADEIHEEAPPFEDGKYHDFPIVFTTLDEWHFNDPERDGPSGLVEQLIDNCLTRGRLRRMAEDHAYLECRPWMMVGENMNVTERAMRDERHFIRYRETASGKLPVWLQAQSMSQDFFFVDKMFAEDRKDYAMLQDVDQGRLPGDVRSGRGIEALQVVFDRAVRIGIRHHKVGWKEIVSREVARLAEFTTEDVMVNIVDDGNMGFMVIPGQRQEPMMEDGAPVMEPSLDAYGQPEVNPMTQEPVMVGRMENVPIFKNVRFDVMVKIGPTQAEMIPGTEPMMPGRPGAGGGGGAPELSLVPGGAPPPGGAPMSGV